MWENFLLSGYYCDTEGLPVPVDVCSRGYYCPAGQVTPTPANYTCPQGYFCLAGVAEPSPCPSGWYQVRHIYRLSLFLIYYIIYLY